MLHGLPPFVLGADAHGEPSIERDVTEAPGSVQQGSRGRVCPTIPLPGDANRIGMRVTDLDIEGRGVAEKHNPLRGGERIGSVREDARSGIESSSNHFLPSRARGEQRLSGPGPQLDGI